MSFLANLFRRTPAHALARGKKALSQKEWAVARLELEEAIEKGEEAVANEARPLLQQARSHLKEMNVQMAKESAEGGEMPQALEGIDTAIGFCDDPVERARLEQIRRTWVRRGGGSLPAAGAAPVSPSPTSEPEPDPEDFEDDENPRENDAWELVLGTLNEQAEATFREQGEEFQGATVMLEQGRAKEAAAIFSTLLRRSPGQPLLLFQRGRARLLMGEMAGAVADLSLVRKQWGFAAIDAAGRLHVGLMLADAFLAAGQLEEATEVLEAVVQEREKDEDAWIILGKIRLAREQMEEAGVAAERLARLAPRRIEGYHLGAEVARRGGDVPRAIALLERGVNTCCGSGSACRVKPVDVPAARALVELYLDQSPPPSRVEALMRQVFTAQEGEASWYDHFLMARYHRGSGNIRGADESKARAWKALPQDATKDRKMLEELVANHLSPQG